jgi:hypothetical protein
MMERWRNGVIVDELLTIVAKVDMMSAYLKAKFSLNKSDKPHAMIF